MLLQKVYGADVDNMLQQIVTKAVDQYINYTEDTPIVIVKRLLVCLRNGVTLSKYYENSIIYSDLFATINLDYITTDNEDNGKLLTFLTVDYFRKIFYFKKFG